MLTILRRIMILSGKHQRRLVLSFVMNFFENTMAAVMLAAIYFVLKCLSEDTLDTTKILISAIALPAALILRFLFKYLEYILQSGVGYEIVYGKRLEIGKKLLHMPMRFYDETDAGKISSVLNNDLVLVEGMTMMFVSKAVGSLVNGILMVGVMLSIDWRVALAACIVYPVAFLLNKRAQQLLIRYSPLRQQVHADASSVMLEYLQGIFVIKAYNLAGKQASRLEEVLKHLEIVSFDFEMKGLPWLSLYFCSFHVGSALVLAVTGALYLSGTLALSSALLFAILLFGIYGPLELLGVSSGFIRLMNACLDRMQAILDYPSEDGKNHDVSIETFDVRFHDVHFSYDQKPVLRGISFYAPERTMTAIIGPSGSGKSTVLNLISRFWDVCSGSIKIGGVDTQSMKSDQVMEHISTVFQKAHLFCDSIYNNISFGNPQASKEEVEGAARKAHCHEFIMQMENGYHTLVGEGGGTLSGGERQRIAIARALLKNSPIVLLDEVTANIDPENEWLLQRAINALVKEKTVFIVAHKLATIQNAHQILVLGEDGSICERGKHEDLLLNEGLYARLWEKSQRVGSWTLS